MKRRALPLIAVATCLLAFLVAASALPSLTASSASALAPASPTSLPDADPSAGIADQPAVILPHSSPSQADGEQKLTPDGSFSDAESLSGVRAATQPDKLPGNYYPGIYMARDWRPVSKAEFPMVVGGHDTFTWAELEPVEGVYDWDRLESMILANYGQGKQSAFGISTYNGRIEGGIAAPAWLVGGYPQATIDCGGGWKIPRYWNSTYQQKYRNFVQALANRYKSDIRVSWTQIGVGLYGEIQPSDDDGIQGYLDTTCVKNAMVANFGSGVDYAQTWINTVNQITDIFMQNFNSGKPTFLVYTPSFQSTDEKCYTTQYGAGKYGTGLFAGGIYANQTGIFNAWPAITYPGGCQKWDPIVSWNRSPTATVPTAMESYHYMLPDMDNFYWGMLNGLNKHIDYMNLESDLFFYNSDPTQKITQNFPMMYFADQYLGKTIYNTPNAWVAMREYDLATNGFGFHNQYVKPQWGNYDFWLYQDYNIAGGRTVTATTVNAYLDRTIWNSPVTRYDPFYDPILAGKGPQGWITRRTSHATGNDYFYLNIEDSLVAARGIQNSAVITVTYFDYGSNSWALQYNDAGGGLQTVTRNRSDSRQWQTTTFYVTDANFNNGLSGNDFRIWNGGVSDLYVHFVAVGPVPGGPTPTATATVTPGASTATPTRTRTSTPPGSTPTRTATATRSATATNTATVTPPEDYDVRVNAGGPDYVDTLGHLWNEDKAYSAGSWGYVGGLSFEDRTTFSTILTTDPELYRLSRYWQSPGGRYRFDVPAGRYAVDMFFCEPYFYATGKRVFSVQMQGTTVLPNFDIFQQAGGHHRALVKSFSTDVTTNTLEIKFANQVDTSTVMALRVRKTDNLPPTPTPTFRPLTPTSRVALPVILLSSP